MPTEAPENLLKSALEKVVFFECRIEQLEADFQAATAERDRLKGELAEAAVRELNLKQELTELQSRYLATRRELEDERQRVVQLRAERDRWLSSMVSATRIRQAGELPDDGHDLASFIAELRAEIDALRSGQKVERTITQPPPPRDAAQLASHMAQAGRIGLTESDRKSMVQSARFDTRAEETVFAFSLRELSSPYPESRARAAERLGALRSREAAAALAAALNQESEASVKPALIDALAATGGEEAVPLLSPHLRDPDVSVRLSALEATVKLAGPQAAHEVDRALSDEATRVRRRAALLAGSLGAVAGAPLLAHASGDTDASVRRVAALALAAFGGETARRALLVAGDDEDLSVRRAAWQALSRLFGESLLSLADEPPLRRRREVRRLEGAPLPELNAALRAAVESRLAEARIAAAPLAPSAPAPAPVEPEVRASAPEARVQAEPEPAASQIPGELAEQLLAEVATSLRGRTLAELSAIAPEPTVAAAAAALVGQGRLVRRRERFFLA